MIKKPLPRKLSNRAFSLDEALSYGLSKSYLTRMVQAGLLERMSRGVYQITSANPGEKEELYHIATLRCGVPSAICLLSALDYYHLTDQVPRRTWILVPESKRIIARHLKMVRSRSPQWEIGIRKTKRYWITTLERTLIDCIRYKRLVGSQVAVSALKRAITQKKIKPGALYDLAKKMHVSHRVRPYVEVLAS
jgi:predicted transcriptional regulator of viral defense system